MVILCSPEIGRLASYADAAAAARVNDDASADHAGPMVNHFLDHFAAKDIAWWRPQGIVRDAEFDLASAARQIDQNLLGPAMLDGVADAFLGDAIDVRGGHRIIDLDGARAAKLATNRKNVGDIGGQMPQRRGESAGEGIDRLQAARQGTGVFDGFLEQYGDVLGRLLAY
jgi:hypothetical protein